MNARALRVSVFLILGAFLAGATLLAWHRPLDGDEGYYASAARLVSEGRQPYRDFFYPQSPLLPYLLSPVYRVAGASLQGMRLAAVLMGALSLWLWSGVLARRCAERPAAAALALLLTAVDPYFLSWGVTVKTFAPANLAVFGVLGALDRARQSRTWGWFAVAGLLAGWCAGVRLLYLPWAGAMGLAAVFWGRSAGTSLGRRQPVIGMGLGLAIGLAPTAVFWLREPDRFLFNTLRYHLLRYSPHDVPGSGPWVQAKDALLAAGRTVLVNPFLAMQCGLALWGWIWLRRRPGHPLRPLARLAALGWAVVTVTGLLPDPFYEQYFTGTWTPLLAPLVAAGILGLWDRARRPRAAAVGVLCLGLALSAVDLGWRRTGMDKDPVWTLDHVHRVARAIQDRSRPGDPVLAFWSGYPFAAGRDWIPGLENHFALGVAEQLTLEQRIRYRVAGRELLLEALSIRNPEVVVLGGWMSEVNTRLRQEDLPVILEELQRQYEVSWESPPVKILTLRPTAVAAPARP